VETLAYLVATGAILSAIFWLCYDAWQFQTVAEPEALLRTTAGVAVARRVARPRVVRMAAAAVPWPLFAAVAAATILGGAVVGWVFPL